MSKVGSFVNSRQVVQKIPTVLFTKCYEEPGFSEADDAADSDTETDILETVKPLSPDSREDESYR